MGQYTIRAGSNCHPYFHSPNIAAHSQSPNQAKVARPLPVPRPPSITWFRPSLWSPLATSSLSPKLVSPSITAHPHILLLVSSDPALIPRLDSPADAPQRRPALVSPGSPRARARWYFPPRFPPPHTWLVTSPGRPRISILRRLRNWRSVCSRRFRISSGSSGGNSSSGARRSAASSASASAPASGLSRGR